MPDRPRPAGSDDATTRRAASEAASGEAHAFAISVQAGPNAGARLELSAADPGRKYVGTSDACDLVLSDPLVSRRHLAVEHEGGRLRITDAGSTNGTFLGPTGVGEVFAVGGESITVGDTTLAVERAESTDRVKLSSRERFGRVLGASAAMRRLYPLAERLALSDVPVIIEGETGTGKELLAEAIHEASARASGPFVVFDCTTAPPTLVESALFGHERGAYTGATNARPGVFEQARGGTLLIDEIGDLDTAVQAKLLRAVQRHEVQRVGGTEWRKCDVRVLAATRRDLESAIVSGQFRDDLYYRLAVARIELPPLRKRHGDIPLLARHFHAAAGGEGDLSESFLERLNGYTWPGNVRELANAIAHRAALGDLSDWGGIWRSSARPPAGTPAAHDPISDVLALDLPFVKARQRVLDEFERRYVERVLDAHGGNVTKAAEASGIARRYFYVIRSRQKV